MRGTWLPVVAAFAFFVLAWKAVVVIGGLPPFILPPPETVADRFFTAWLDGTIWPHFATTMVEVKRLIDPDMLVEIEADAILSQGQ